MAPAVGIAAFYFLYLGALGAFWPFYGPLLERAGLGASEVGWVMALTPLSGVVVPPVLGLLADARGARGWIVRAVTLAACVSFVGFLLVAYGVGGRAVVWGAAALFAASRSPILSLTDAAALDVAARGGPGYGVIRVWGSVGFLGLAVLAGVVQDHVGGRALAWMTWVGLALTAALAWRQPAPPPSHHHEAVRGWLELVRRPSLWPFLAAVALGYVGNSTLDVCYSRHLEALGHGSTFIGVAWAVGVLAEVVLLLASGPLLGRGVRGETLFLVGVAGGLVRWWLLSFVRTPAALLGTQVLHGLGFGWFYVAGVTVMRHRGAAAPTAAQGLFNGAIALGSISGMLVGGTVMARVDGFAAFQVAAAAQVAALLLSVVVRAADRARPRGEAPVEIEREAA